MQSKPPIIYPRWIFNLAFILLLTGCFDLGPKIAGYSKTHVWIKNPTYSLQDSSELAQQHCSTMGKIAELESNISLDLSTNDIMIYMCK